MKTKLLTILLIFIVALPLMAAPPYKSRTERPMSAVVDNATYINANKILMFVTNHANFCRDLSGVFGHDAGTFYPYVDDASINDGSLDDYILYASGLWVGGLVNSEIRVAVAEYSDEYVPGPMDEFVSATGNDTTWTFNAGFDTDPAYKVYKLYSDSMADNPNADWTNWPVGDGAPVDDQGDPDMIGDQMLWAVYNDANPDAHDNGSGETLPLGIEIRQTTWAFDREDALGEIIFIRFQVFNKGGNTIEDCHFSLWCDPDLGEYTDDLVGCFVDEDLGYVYNSDNDDANHYFDKPPAVGYDFFQGPLMFTGIDTDSAKMWGQKWGGYLNMGMTSFNKYINGTDPNNFNETFNYMQGLQANGDPYEFPLGSGEVTKYMHAGDPTAGTGDIDFDPADRRWMQTTGPITFAPGDSTEFVAAIVVGQAIDRLTSISLMKHNDNFAQMAYDNDFELPEPPAKPIVTASSRNQGISLRWTDTSEVDHGTYPFEGYMIWQGETSTGPWKQVAALDIANGIEKVFDLVFDPVTAVAEYRLVWKGSEQGVKHHIILEDDHVLGGPLRNITEYHYKVEAYTVDLSRPEGFRSLSAAVTESVTPQQPVAEEEYSAFLGDTLESIHIGLSDGFITPLVIDHTTLTGNDYRVVFQDTVMDIPGVGTVDQVWHLENVTTGARVLEYQPNQSGDEDYEIVDGLLLKVNGAPLVGKEWDYASADPANLSPVSLAEWTDDEGNPYEGGRWFTGGTDFGGELFFGGVFLEPNFWGVTSVLPPEYPKVEIRWRPMVSYTDLNGDELFTIGEPFEVDDPAETQGAFMYTGFSGATYEGFYDVPFTAWDVDDPDNPRQLNVAMRDRDQNTAWNIHWQADTLTNPDDTLLPNRGDMRYNYTWICITDYDATGTYYGDGTGGTIDFWSYDGGNGVWDGAWVLWLGDRGNGGMLAEEGTFTLVPNLINTPADTFTFSTDVLTVSMAEAVLDNITVAPNPFYLYGPYDPAPGNYQIMFQNLPTECVISIYNLAGEFVYEIEKNDPATSTASWGANTTNGLPVASGIYLWVVDAKGIGQKVGKIAVFTEVELLQTY